MLREGCALCRPCPGAVPSAPPRALSARPSASRVPHAQGLPGAVGAAGTRHPPQRGAAPSQGRPGRASGPGEEREARAGRRSAGVRLLPAPQPRRRCGVTRPPSSSACTRGPVPAPASRPFGTAPSGTTPTPPDPTPPGGVQGLARALGARTGWGGAGPRVQGTQTKGVPAGAAGRSARTISPHAPSPNLPCGSRILGSECLVKAV